MSIFSDMRSLYEKYGFFEKQMTLKQLEFRIKTLQIEELDELEDALDEKNPEELVDALIDTIVIAAGTLELLGVDGEKAWAMVLKANFAKERGTKSTRPESGGFDLIKPDNWKAPNHLGNHGALTRIFRKRNETS